MYRGVRSTRDMLVAAVFLAGGISPVVGQLVEAPTTRTDDGRGAVQPQADTALADFSGVEIRAARVVQEPGSDVIRVIVQATESADPGRRAALVRPKPVLIDDLGNVYELQSVTGMSICQSRSWDVDAEYCATRHNLTTDMKPRLSTPIVFVFKPQEALYNAELAGMAERVALNVRLALYARDDGKALAADVVVPDLVLARLRKE